jgi:lysophospholipase
VIRTDEESGIMYREWGGREAKAVFLLVHGLGAHSARWESMALYMARQGVSSYALELKGFGETPEKKGHIDSFKTYFKDIRCLGKIIARDMSGSKIYIAGESLGALIAFCMTAGDPDLFDGLICVAPAFKSRMILPVFEYVRLALAMAVFPEKQFKLPFDPAMCTRDEALRRQMKDDEREHTLATARLLFETARAQYMSRKAAKHITGPVLFLVPGADKLTDPFASVSIFKHITAGDKTLIEYPGMYHSLTIEQGREKVFGDILNWALDRQEDIENG